MTPLDRRDFLRLGTAILLIGALVLTRPVLLSAQSASANLDPASTVRAFWEAVFAARWPEAVDLLNLADVDRLRRQQVKYARAPRGRDYTAADLMLRDPEMPREAAEYEIRKQEKERKQFPERPFWMYYGVDSAAQLERMPLEEVAMRWLQAADPLWQVQEVRRVNHCPLAQGLDSLRSTRHALVYGSVPAGTDTAIVAFRSEWFPVLDFFTDPGEIRPPQFAVLTKGQAGWRIHPLRGLLENVRGGLAGFDLSDCPRRKPT